MREIIYVIDLYTGRLVASKEKRAQAERVAERHTAKTGHGVAVAAGFKFFQPG